jgi:hypothetical protein
MDNHWQRSLIYLCGHPGKNEGKYSVLAQASTTGMKGLMYVLPENYAGKKLLSPAI